MLAGSAGRYADIDGPIMGRPGRFLVIGTASEPPELLDGELWLLWDDGYSTDKLTTLPSSDVWPVTTA